ncbi:MAG: hypothetical protein IJF30_01875 [Clostridia bacterium]|nr:hypothetical protein [Clostridia bacterium]MBQ9997872.1 hypothetical protein [Clostridia bacterium]
MENFWDSNVWSSIMLFAVLLGSLLAGNVLKKSIPLLRVSLIPTSVLGGSVLIIVAAIYKAVTGDVMFDTPLFGSKGTATLEIITYHTLALGFIASSLKSSGNKLTKKRCEEIFNTGVTTVSTYLLQGVFGLAITIVASLVVSNFFSTAGMLLPFGYGQGTGQALNYGNIYETQYGFAGGKSFGLTIAALGFLSASFGGVIHLNIMKKRGKFSFSEDKYKLNKEKIEADDEIPMQESIDKMTIQIALIFVSYVVAYLLMYLLGKLLPGMKATVYGFNFLLGVLSATLIKTTMNFLKKKRVIKKEYMNDFLLTRASNFFFDIMVVAGIAAIRLDVLQKYWGIMLILGVVGLVITYIYNRMIAITLFKEYPEEQFLAMYGMLTGTASTGIILLREVDCDFKTPAADNLVYQNFPAIAFGFPLMLLASLAPVKPVLTLIIMFVFFIIMNVILFRKQLFGKKGN